MYCRSCGFNNQSKSLYCQNCGLKLENQNTNNEELVKIYMGKNADKFLHAKKGYFSVYPLIFSAFYLIYRKMYLYAILWFVIQILSVILLPTYATSINFFLTIVVCGLVNKLYVKQANEKVEEIKQKNIGMPYEQLKQIVAKKGGTSKIIIIIPIAIVILMIILTPIIVGLK